MADFSTQIPCGLARRAATALLRASGGAAANLQMPPAQGDSTDAGQLGLNAPGFLSLPLSPVVLQKPPRFVLEDGQLPKYELLVSADAVQAQVSQQKLASAQALFAMAAGVEIAGRLFLIEAVSSSVAQGEPYLYRLLLQETCGEWPV